MGRLKASPARLGAMTPKLAAAPKVADRFYQSVDWKRLRAEKKAQGPAYCCVCGSTGRLILDHREERKDGGADLPGLGDLDWYCTADHNRKTARARAARAQGR